MSGSPTPSDSPATQIFYNIIGGVIVAALTALYVKFLSSVRNWRLQKIFGCDFRKNGSFTVVYGRYQLYARCDENGVAQQYPFGKTPRERQEGSPTHLAIQDVASGAEIRGAAYLASLFGRARAVPPKITTDHEIDESLDLSFVALGGPRSNFKTGDVLDNPANDLVRLNRVFTNATNQRPIRVGSGEGDYGLILRIRPNQFPDRVWLVCAGYGEWGTSGAAWFLANKWSSLLNKALPWWNPLAYWRGHDFAAILTVKKGQDESGMLLKLYRTKRDVDADTTKVDERSVAPAEQTTTFTCTVAPGLTPGTDAHDDQQASAVGYHGGSIDPSQLSSPGNQPTPRLRH